MKLAVLSPGGRDADQGFDPLPGPDDSGHAPVNFHGFAAALGGSFHRKDQTVPAETKNVLLLIRHDLKSSRQALIELRAAKKTVVVSFKEAGTYQVAEALRNGKRLKLLREICSGADGALAVTEELIPVYQAAGARQIELIPTPYPVEEAKWDLSRPFESRRGVFLGTREFKVGSRHHLLALCTIKPLIEAMGEPLAVFNTDGWRGRALLRELRYPDELLRIHEQRLLYAEYLRLIAQHKLVFQLDQSNVPGQVAGDALLCRVPCVGGNGTTERQVFPELCGHGRSPEMLFDIAARLLEHPHDCQAAVEHSVELARLRIGFQPIAKRVEDFFRRISRE